MKEKPMDSVFQMKIPRRNAKVTLSVQVKGTEFRDTSLVPRGS
jgi:hypothetical protein